MLSRRASWTLVLLMVAGFTAPSVFAKKSSGSSSGTPLSAAFSTIQISTSNGVFDDGLGPYVNGISGVQCYFGVNGNDLDLVTYSTNRTLHFYFDPSSSAWQASGLPSNFTATVDFYGINYFGQYASQAVGTTAQVQATLQFLYGNSTYELDYQSLASYRESSSTWLITSSPNDLLGYPGFSPSDQAAFSKIRHGQKSYGAVNMPIRFEVTVQ